MTDEDIIAALEFEDASDDVKQRAVDSVRAVVDIRVGGLIGEYLTDEQSAEFERLQQAGDDQAVWSWLRSEVTQVDMSEVYEATLQSYLEEVQDK
jgi:hypothetical protein